MLSSSIPTSTTATNDTALGDHGGQRLMGKFHPKTRPFYRWCRRAGCKKYSLHRWYFHSPKRMVPSRLLSFKPGTVHHRTTPGGKQLPPFASEMRDKLWFMMFDVCHIRKMSLVTRGSVSGGCGKNTAEATNGCAFLSYAVTHSAEKKKKREQGPTGLRQCVINNHVRVKSCINFASIRCPSRHHTPSYGHFELFIIRKLFVVQEVVVEGGYV